MALRARSSLRTWLADLKLPLFVVKLMATMRERWMAENSASAVNLAQNDTQGWQRSSYEEH